MKDENWIDRVSGGSVANALGSPIASSSVREAKSATMLSLPPEKLAELMPSVLDHICNTYHPFGVIPDNGPGSGGFYLRNQTIDMYALEYERRYGRVVRFDPKADLSSFTALRTTS